ncbi:hypothetical protein K3722_08485 [Leisingera caerulea]|uniref:Secreted protein n=1 Tax=Leisingera caerulea TaxID=506591 RepID=A0ABY5X0Q1_LEICA|nr:hypothetical protein [Leisingera caerulea]UWQ51402.1 hypothetical protein K3720_08285 [Leisingera caerulea]UWQ60155.1 hypothetical protein K3722_08485 [Leisingera caerulea]UWQ64239.1 hypothetical protein K3723_08125 [Leisingera caerulea]UWQ85197.1 hypothetical protein K3726_08335 [Leisingera caerulea]
MSLFASILVLGIVVMTAVVAVVSQRRRPLEEDDTDPDYHTLRSDYQSGMGGGSVRTWKVPKDPQEYARFFVPKNKLK